MVPCVYVYTYITDVLTVRRFHGISKMTSSTTPPHLLPCRATPFLRSLSLSLFPPAYLLSLPSNTQPFHTTSLRHPPPRDYSPLPKFTHPTPLLFATHARHTSSTISPMSWLTSLVSASHFLSSSSSSSFSFYRFLPLFLVPTNYRRVQFQWIKATTAYYRQSVIPTKYEYRLTVMPMVYNIDEGLPLPPRIPGDALIISLKCGQTGTQREKYIDTL